MIGHQKGKQSSSPPQPGSGQGFGYDGFAVVDCHIYLCNSHGNTIWRTDLDGNNQELIAGDANSTSAAAFGRTKMDRNVLFVLTAGGLGEMGRVPVVGGQILALNAR